MKLKALLFITIVYCQPVLSRQAIIDKVSPKTKHRETTHPVKALYQSLLQTWCDGLLRLQINSGADSGGIYCGAHQYVHGRCADAVYPLLTLYRLTKKEKYKTAALKVYHWSETHVAQPDGSWINETDGKNDWKGISVFSTISVGEALRHNGNLLSAAENREWKERLRSGGDFVLSNIGFETGDINYPISAAAALTVCWKVLGDEKYLQRAKELAAFGRQHFTVNNLIWGEGVRGPNDTTASGLRPVDVPYNLEESLPNLALYARLTNDQETLNAVTQSIQAHLNFVMPDGSLDAGWCSRQYKWIYFGSSTSDGLAGGLALTNNTNNRFGEVAYRNALLMQSYTHYGLLNGGADLFASAIRPCSHHTFTRAKGLATAIDAGIENTPATTLPIDSAYGVREWKEVKVIQVAIGDWRASVTTNDIASSKKRGGHPMGGALSMLWHRQAGPLALASMNDYVTYEPSNMQKELSDKEQFCLTPRIEVINAGHRYSNIYDPGAVLTWIKKDDSITVKIIGNVRDVHGDVVPGGESAFEVNYIFTKHSFQMLVHSNALRSTLIFPVISPSAEPVLHTNDKEIRIRKKGGSIKIIAAETAHWQYIADKRVFNFVPGFEALLTKSALDKQGNAAIRLEVTN